ncbi:hypothetical protein KI688_009995 [Linnemannia hyalina]|uniref:Arrestin-like N-terminal domain-containing protein n=1 Tax=Linnemannia hyalina TaxID=64524 RepID=A0A9P8BUT9_9FUNG|nr:hypothetical protein KI688_009995 [Linnemannia hyalina]
MPLVYGSTPERVGSIRGTVRFSTNYPCKGKDVVIMYEAKAEAQWSALENKKVVKHQTEEILGYHIWHFPLEHTKTGGSTVAVGVYEKEFEIPLVHPSSAAAAAASSSSPLRNNNPSASPPSPPSSPSPSPSAGSAAASSKSNSALIPHTTSTVMVGAKQVGPVSASATAAGLLPSSSYSPQARIKYTIRAILQRPFPFITHVEASQEVWVFNSSLPPQFPLLTPLSPSNSTGRRSHSNASSKKRLQSAKTNTTSAAATTTTTATTNPTPAEKAPDKESSKSLECSEVLKSQSLLSLPMPSQVFKSALAMLPSIDLSRSKQLFSISKTAGPSPASASEPASGSETGAGSRSGTTAAASSFQPSTSAAATTPDNATTPTATTTTTATKDSTDITSEAGSSSSCSSVSSPRLDGRENNYNHQSHPEDTDNDNIADYTGVWEAFDIPYSLSLPSEMVYVGQVVPLTIRFGPHHGYCSSSNKQQEQGNAGHQDTPSRRFMVKKGVLRLMEHTLLREVTTTQVPLSKSASAQNKNHNKSLVLMTTNAHAPSQATLEKTFEDDGSTKDSSHRRAFSEQQPHPNSNGKSKRMVPLFGKRQDQNAIYQEQGYHGSHSHLPLPGGGDSDAEQQRQRNTKSQHQHQLSVPGGGDAHSSSHKHEGDLRKSFFKPNRHSMDVSTGRPVSMVNPYGPTNGSNPRIVSSIEAKFKTEVMLLSLTPFLQRQEQWYQRKLNKAAFDSAAGSTGRTHDGSDGDKVATQQKEDNEEERGDMYVEEEDVEEDIEDGVWQTTIWVPIPGPSAMATFTETKNIIKTHTLQLILLCGLGGEAVPVPAAVVQGEDGEADSGSGSAAASVAAVSLSNVNKEFRLEMDLHVTGPRSPVEMTIKHL